MRPPMRPFLSKTSSKNLLFLTRFTQFSSSPRYMIMIPNLIVIPRIS